jgi:hypothetical protein
MVKNSLEKLFDLLQSRHYNVDSMGDPIGLRDSARRSRGEALNL